MSDLAYKDLFELYYAAWYQLEEAMIDAGREAKMRSEEAAEWLRKRLAYVQKLETVTEAAKEVSEAFTNLTAAHEPDREIYRWQYLEEAQRKLREAIAELEVD